MPDRRALITGIGGQDGSYLTEHLLANGVEVLGVERPGGASAHSNLAAVADRVAMVEVDLLDAAAIVDTVESVAPTEIYHLAAGSFVPASWLHPAPTVQMAAVSTAGFLDAIVNVDRSIRFFQAASAEVFGRPPSSPQDEQTPIAPVSPYGAAKALGLFLTRMYRERYGIHASTGILFNHESPRRPVDFVTRKVTRAAAAISLGLESELRLGNLDAERDWGFAGDYVKAMALMVRHDAPGDYVVATGETRSIRDLLDAAFACLDLEWADYVVIDEQFSRPTEAARICGDPSKAERDLGWRREVSFAEMVATMVDHDLASLRL